MGDFDRCQFFKKYRALGGNRHWYRTKYLKSSRWRKLRKQKLALNPTCQVCRTASNLDVHHCRYRKDLKLTILDDLLTLCRSCHKREHSSLT